MSETAVGDTPGFEVLENVSSNVAELDRSPQQGNVSELRTDVGHSSGEEIRNVVVSDTTVRGHSLELEIEGELDYDEIEDTHLTAPNSKTGDKGNQEKTQQQPPQRISWNEWTGNGDSQEAKPANEEQPINEQQEHRRPREDHRHRGENSRRNSSRRYRESAGGRSRSPPASNFRRPVVQNPGRRTGESETRSGGGGNTGLRIPPGMNHQHHHRGKFPSVSQFQDSEGLNHHPVERGMPPGLGISRNPGPGNHPPPMENRGGNQWRTGPRFQRRSPPPGPRVDDRPPPRRDHVHPERIQRCRIPQLASHRSPPPSEGVPSMNRRTRSPGRVPGPLPYAERSFIARNNARERPPARHGAYHKRNSGSPRLPNRVPASPRRVTLPVRGPSTAGMGHYHRSKNQNPPVVQRRPPSPGVYRQPSPVELRRGQFHQQPPFRRPHNRQDQSPPLRRPPEYLDRQDRRPRGRNHHRSPSPGRSNKRQRANSQDRRFGLRPSHHPLEPNSPPPHLTQSHNGTDGRLKAPLHHPEMDCIWFYVDPQGHTQGPCTIRQFRSWLKTLAEDPQYVDEHKHFRGVSVWKEGMHERYSMTELLDRNVG